MPREFADPYVYPGTDVLQNKAGLRTESAFRQYEYESSAQRIVELRRAPISGQFDLEHLRALHRHIFQDVYGWAGEVRQVHLRKGGDQFAHPAFIETSAQKIVAEFSTNNQLRGLNKSDFVEQFSHTYAEWNAVHPFREGNGRATRELLIEIARNAGYVLSNDRITTEKDAWNKAARAAFTGDLAPVKQIFMEAVQPARAVAFARLPEQDALQLHPELKGAYERLATMRLWLSERFPGNQDAQALYYTQTKSEVQRGLDAGQILQGLPREKSPSLSKIIDRTERDKER
ncbi:MAG: Fic/DOC family protein [Casimicrobium sp.]